MAWTAQRRQVRGLVRAIRESGRLGPTARTWEKRRGLLDGTAHPDGRGKPGHCGWCGLPTSTGTHPECYVAYKVAYGEPASGVALSACPCGLAGDELDHRIPLGLARKVGTPWLVVRAWSCGNIQSLCRHCHVAKSRHDSRLIRSAENGCTAGRRSLGRRAETRR